MTEKERVREETACKICWYRDKCNDLTPIIRIPSFPDRPRMDICEEQLKEADQILAIDGIRIEADDQSLPKVPSQYVRWFNKEAARDYAQDMLKAGFIRVLPKEK